MRIIVQRILREGKVIFKLKVITETLYKKIFAAL